MRALIAFGTIEGQTGKVAEFAEDRLTERGYTVDVANLGDTTRDVSLEGYDKVILAASVHERCHTKSFEVFARAQNERLNASDVLLLSISLNAAFPEGQEEAQDYVDEMLSRTGLKPSKTLLVAGALRASRYDYYQMQVLRHVILRGRDFDPTQSEYEFTDWEALGAELDAFCPATAEV